MLSRPVLKIVLLGIAAFVVALIVMWPAKWTASALPPNLRCAAWSGSIWNGMCSGVEWQNPTSPLRLERVQWRLRPLALLRARLQADVVVEDPGVLVRGRVTAGAGGRIRVESLEAAGPVDQRVLSSLPSGWSARFEIHEAVIEQARGRLQELHGTFIARDMRDQRGAALGDYELKFAGQSAPFRGQLRDLSGPMQIAATVSIDANRAWRLEGTAALRPGAPATLVRGLDQLASADLNGQRRIAIEGTVD